MAIRIPTSTQKLLLEQGLVPDGCRSVELVLAADSAMILRYEVFVTTEQLEKLAVVFQALASEAKPNQDGD